MPANAPVVAELEEKALLALIFPRLGKSTALLGPGDDAAIVSSPDSRTVVSIDTLVQGEDFRLEWPSGYRTSGYDVGWKCAAQNMSDINAMGAIPTSLVVSLTLPGSTPVDWVEDLADGLTCAIVSLGADACSVVGGDLGRGREIVVTAAVTGDLQGRAPVLRSGARPGDMMVVAGELGRAAGGLAVLESSLDYFALDKDTAGNRDLRDLTLSQRRPRPPLQLGPVAAAAGATAMLDISDGLVRDAGRIASASGVRVELDGRVLKGRARPLEAAAAKVKADAMEWVLAGGEDHGLLACFPAGATIPAGFERIGVVADGSGVSVDGQRPHATGWDHFAG